MPVNRDRGEAAVWLNRPPVAGAGSPL